MDGMIAWRDEESFVATVRPDGGGGARVRAHGAVHWSAADRMSQRLGVQPVRV